METAPTKPSADSGDSTNMRFIVALALRKRSVTLLAIALVLAAGVFAYQTRPVELFPEIEFPFVTVTAFYPSANPESVARDVAIPIERAVADVPGVDSVQSVSSENSALVIGVFEFGVDMAEAEAAVNSNLSGVAFPEGVGEPMVARFNPDAIPVLQLSVVGDRELSEIQRIAAESLLPPITDVEGVYAANVTGGVRREVSIRLDYGAMSERGISQFQVAQALRNNSVALPGGAIFEDGRLLPVKTSSGYESLDDLRNLTVGFASPPAGAPPSASAIPSAIPPAPPMAMMMGAPVTLGEIAEVEFGEAVQTSVSRTNGRPGIGIGVVKEPDANTLDVTNGVLAALEGVDGLPPDVQIITVSNSGVDVQSQIDTLQREAILGLILAVAVVFAFFLTLRPTAIRGAFSTLRPTIVIGMSIPLSIFAGVLLMSWQGLSLNFMTLGGLAISVGRVVDDSIVALENIYRNISAGKERWRAALDATVEVGPAIAASTLATIVVFAPLAFIQGLVGAFFFPFALTVSFALVASLAVALTAVPVMAAYLIKPGDLPEGVGEGADVEDVDNWMQRAYEPVLRWALRRKAATLLAAAIITAGGFGLVAFIPVNLFSGGGDRFIDVRMTLPPGTPISETLAQTEAIESAVAPYSAVYTSTVGGASEAFGAGGATQTPSGVNQATIFATLSEDAPADTAAILRRELRGAEGRRVNVTEVSAGPPQAGVDVRVTGANYDDIADAARRLASELRTLDGVENVVSDVSEARDEIAVDVDPARAAAIGLDARQVAFQVNQYIVGQRVTDMVLDGESVAVRIAGAAGALDGVEKAQALTVAGPLGSAALSDVADVQIRPGPVAINRTDGLRSASVTGVVTSDNAQAIGAEIQAAIDALDVPPGVSMANGGVFTQTAEGFEDIFIAMAVGVALVYLVMVATLGSLRNPFVIITSMPLALIGAMAALALTGRSLGLPAMMGALMLIGIVVTNAVVLITFVEQLRERGMGVRDALIRGARIRLRPILMTAITTSIALLPLAAVAESQAGLIGAELATVVIGGLVSSTLLTLIVVPVVYTLMNDSLPCLFRRLSRRTAATASE